MPNNIFHAYSDESGFPADRYQTLAVVSGRLDNLAALRSHLRDKLGNGVKEVKWEEIRGHRPKTESAIGYLELAITYAISGKIRIDVLAWDTRDQRHTIYDRDDVANLERMYYKNMIHIARQWNNPIWALFPDENSVLDWQEIIGYLNNTRLQKPRFMSLFQASPVNSSSSKRFPKGAQQVNRSCSWPICLQEWRLFAA